MPAGHCKPYKQRKQLQRYPDYKIWDYRNYDKFDTRDKEDYDEDYRSYDKFDTRDEEDYDETGDYYGYDSEESSEESSEEEDLRQYVDWVPKYQPYPQPMENLDYGYGQSPYRNNEVELAEEKLEAMRLKMDRLRKKMDRLENKINPWNGYYDKKKKK